SAAPWAEAHRRIDARRQLLGVVQAAWDEEPLSGTGLPAPGRSPSGLAEADDGRLLWWLPRTDGAHDVALLTAPEFVAAARAAGRGGALAEWPFFVEPDFARSEIPFAGVLGLRGVVPATVASPGQQWLMPAATVLVLLAFGFAVSQRLRAARGEVLAVRTQAEFLTTVTHELKTPLAAIRLLAEMLAEGRAIGKENDYYRMLAGEAGRLSLLIENVLDLGRLERGQRAYDLRGVDVADVLGEVVAMFTPLAARDGMRLEWRDELGSTHARRDRGAFVQALVAVLDNARKYGATGGVLELVSRRDGAGFAVDVRDRGPGVPADERERVFERFVRGSAHAHGSTPGIGIGLYLARSIARRLGGDLVCAAPLDGGPGACFTFTLPLAAA
ncbi:MAG TPA: HAMP domain-containing sensor histidine kinase, partial [Xanthomonadales bacterium]|nr:HAMP domain-containing sensor histidine kinase [Xanthomonadales bacterium]